MTKEELFDLHKDTPEIIEDTIDMVEANSSIKIYEGEYILKGNNDEITITGNIYFDWVPSSGAHFYGKPLLDINNLFQIVNSSNSFRLIIDGLEFGKCLITNTSFGNSNNDPFIKGIIIQQAVLGDKSIAVEKLKFSIPNLRDFYGLPVKKITDKNFTTSMNRLRLEDDNYIITIDKCLDYKERIKLLKEKGGYIILFTGELTYKKGAITQSDTKEILHCLNTFLTFLNGRRTSAQFIRGVHDNRIIWQDFTWNFTDSYKYVQTWPQTFSVSGLNELWSKFNLVWRDNDDKNFLITVIHWYIEANGHSGFSEGSIIMAQTALELLYNWWIIENKQMILGKDSENISAANKIRLLLSQLNINCLVPPAFKQLQEFVKTTDNVIDAPDAVVYIRNAIVHSQIEKRKKLSAIHFRAKYEALQLCIWYIEMSLLAILDFDEKYFNRCSEEIISNGAEENVPWSKKKTN